MRKALKYRLKIPNEVRDRLETTLDSCRTLYNTALQQRRDTYQMHKTSIHYTMQANELPTLKTEFPEFQQVHSQVLQEVLKRVQKAFDGFFRRIKTSQKPGYPRFQSKKRYDSFTFPQGGWKLDGNTLQLSKIGKIRIRMSRPIEGEVKTVTIKQEANHWYVIFSCEIPDVDKQLPETAKMLGIDLGLESFYTDHNDKHIDNPRYLRKSQEKIKKAQRELSKKQKYSGRWKRQVQKIIKLNLKITNQRKDFLHKLSRKIINSYDIIVFEDLNISGMVRNHKLAKSISDAAWGMFVNMLEYKAEWAGKIALNVNPRGTSQECSQCHQKVLKGLSIRWHKCPHCGLILHRTSG